MEVKLFVGTIFDFDSPAPFLADRQIGGRIMDHDLTW